MDGPVPVGVIGLPKDASMAAAMSKASMPEPMSKAMSKAQAPESMSKAPSPIP
eukprot:CAMPEP_0204081686 /NCGR_PEP_ID=MMETSP0360-20130528/175897_1 /ASSEMBLY_ACC=CAM_ASM_000342 /TAXON_ID=268821 /ORGANISM="Scrippsiella Hangoei, Strain SHTV-5" /LENGTH=52 /DNA_ID=CAMNT_0051030527 /DNA_START=42 /DNA_END=197 /DNA_ORIENTATION=+